MKLKATVDRMFVILPFEKDFYQKFDWPVDYVGNPVLDAIKAHKADPNFITGNKLSREKPIVALLPGSRKQELMRMVPIMAEVVKDFPQYQFAVGAISTLDKELYKPLTAFSNVNLIMEDTYNLLLNATAAIVTSGTATLETSLFRVPQTVIYKASGSTFAVVKLLIKVKWISLVNLIAGKEVIKELIQQDANGLTIGNELRSLVTDVSYRKKIFSDYDEIIKTLDTGSASENAANLMVKYLKN